VFVSLCALLLAEAPSFAQTPTSAAAVSPANDADALYEQGGAAFDAGKLDRAYDLYRRAWALRQTYDIAGNLAQVELALGKKRDAAEHIAFTLTHFPPSVHTDRRQKIKAVLDGLRRDLGVLRINVNLTGARIAIDSAPVGNAPVADEVFVDPGAHVVEATLAGYQPARAQVDAPKGLAQDVALTLLPVPTPPPGGGGPSAGGPSKPVIISGAVLGGVGVLLGAVFAGVSDAKASDAAAKNGAIVMGVTPACGSVVSANCQAIQSAGQARATFANASAWSFIAGGAVGVATVIYAIAAPRAAKKSGARVVPLVAADGGGVVVRGEW
jgi:hypothetical protein